MKLLIFAVLAAVALTAPNGRADDQCGAKQVPKVNFIPKGAEEYDVGCELCLDLVLIAETYAECGEAEVEHAMEKKCDDEYPNGGPADKACRQMVDKVAHEVIEDTEQNPTGVCYKVIHKNCTYSIPVYDAYAKL